jgi:Zn-dependent M28 family amino/carboxypeptidase
MAAAARGELDGVVSSLNLDMLGVGERLAVRRSSDGTWDVISATLAGTLVGATPISETPLPPSSDHWSFHEAGIPSAQLTREPDNAWHTPGDTIDRIDPVSLDESEEAAASLVQGALDHFASGRLQGGLVTDEAQTAVQ